MQNLEIYCVTDKEVPFLEKTNYKLAAVGLGKFSQRYIRCDKKDNIFHKEKNYSELTFHYWFWKNELKKFNSNTWIGFCQKRRFWVKDKIKIRNLKTLRNNLISKPDKKWKKYNSIICKPIRVDKPKKIKILKRGWRNLTKDPSVLINQKKTNNKITF